MARRRAHQLRLVERLDFLHDPVRFRLLPIGEEPSMPDAIDPAIHLPREIGVPVGLQFHFPHRKVARFSQYGPIIAH